MPQQLAEAPEKVWHDISSIENTKLSVIFYMKLNLNVVCHKSTMNGDLIYVGLN